MQSHHKGDSQKKRKKNKLIFEKLKDFPTRFISDLMTNCDIPIEHEFPMELKQYHKRAVSILLDNGKLDELALYFKIHQLSFREYLSLKKAVQSGYPTIITWLLEVNVDINTHELQAAYRTAIRGGYQDIAALIDAKILAEMAGRIPESLYLHDRFFPPIRESDTTKKETLPFNPKK